MACTCRGCPYQRPDSFPSLPLIWAATSHLVDTCHMGLRRRAILQVPPSQESGWHRVPRRRSIQYPPPGLGKTLMQHSPRRSSPALVPARPSSWTYSRRSWPSPQKPWTALVQRFCSSTTPKRWDQLTSEVIWLTLSEATLNMFVIIMPASFMTSYSSFL